MIVFVIFSLFESKFKFKFGTKTIVSISSNIKPLNNNIIYVEGLASWMKYLLFKYYFIEL